jgi:hypothetical protein
MKTSNKEPLNPLGLGEVRVAKRRYNNEHRS